MISIWNPYIWISIESIVVSTYGYITEYARVNDVKSYVDALLFLSIHIPYAFTNTDYILLFLWWCHTDYAWKLTVAIKSCWFPYIFHIDLTIQIPLVLFRMDTMDNMYWQIVHWYSEVVMTDIHAQSVRIGLCGIHTHIADTDSIWSGCGSV